MFYESLKKQLIFCLCCHWEFIYSWRAACHVLQYCNLRTSQWIKW